MNYNDIFEHIIDTDVHVTTEEKEKWNNMDVDVDWDKITNKPTTLEGYGITDVYTKDEIQDNTLNKIKATNNKILIDTGFSLGVKDGDNLISYNYGTSGAPTLKLGSSAYISSYMSNMDIVAPTQLMLKTDNLNLKTKLLSLQGSYGSFSVDVSDNKGNNKLYASIPAEFTDIVKAPRLNIYSGNNTVLEGALWNSTYNINGVIKDGLHLSHENGKYLALAYKNASTGIYNSYMIFDVEGVLKNDSDGDDWGPVRFEQNVFFRHGLKIGGGEDIILAGKGVNTRITALENAISQGTGMVEWNNVLNKPSTFTPSSHSHTISEITNLQTTLDGKASSTHNHDTVYVKQDGSTPITSRQQLKMGSYVFEAHAGNGTEGYALVAEFKISKNYQNTPIKIELARRGVLYSNITIQFRNTNSPDPTLQNFVYEGSDCMAYMVKADTSTWNLYIRKTEGYDVIFITKYSNPNSAITTIWKESLFTSLPDGGTYATPLQHSISEITNLQTILDGKLSTDNGLISTKSGCIILSNTQGYLGKDKTGATHVIGLIGNDNYCYLGGNLINTYIRSKDCPQYLDPSGNKYNIYHSGYSDPVILNKAANDTEVNNLSVKPGIYTLVKRENFIPGYGAYFNVLNMGCFSDDGGYYRTQLAMPYQSSQANNIFIRKGYSDGTNTNNKWSSWERMAKISDLNNYALIGHSHTNISPLGRKAPMTGRNAISGIYCYSTSGSDSTGSTMPSGYCVVIGFGDGTGGSAEIAISYTGNGMWFRYLRDYQDNWSSWTRLK